MSNEFLKAVATMPPNVKRVFVSLPEEHQDTVLNDLDTFTNVVLRQEEYYDALGFEPDEVAEKIKRSVVQSYELAR